MKTYLYNKYDTQNLENKLVKSGITNFLLMMRAGNNLYQIIKKTLSMMKLLLLQALVIMVEMLLLLQFKQS